MEESVVACADGAAEADHGIVAEDDGIEEAPSRTVRCHCQRRCHHHRAGMEQCATMNVIHLEDAAERTEREGEGGR